VIIVTNNVGVGRGGVGTNPNNHVKSSMSMHSASDVQKKHVRRCRYDGQQTVQQPCAVPSTKIPIDHQRTTAMAPPPHPSPYADAHKSLNGPGDARPTAYQILKDEGVVGKMTDKTFLVTGGTAGLGLETVRQLAKTGARVFFTARDEEKAKAAVDGLLEEGKTDAELKDARVEWVKIDHSSLKSVKEGTEDFLERSDQLDVLVCNAGKPMNILLIQEAVSLTNNRDIPDPIRYHRRRLRESARH